MDITERIHVIPAQHTAAFRRTAPGDLVHGNADRVFFRIFIGKCGGIGTVSERTVDLIRAFFEFLQFKVAVNIVEQDGLEQPEDRQNKDGENPERGDQPYPQAEQWSAVVSLSLPRQNDSQPLSA